MPSVGADELVARFITSIKWVRGSDNTVRQDAFIPHPYPELSVTRHRGLSAENLWRIGQQIADSRPATLYGRADATPAAGKRQKPEVEPPPGPQNLNPPGI